MNPTGTVLAAGSPDKVRFTSLHVLGLNFESVKLSELKSVLGILHR